MCNTFPSPGVSGSNFQRRCGGGGGASKLSISHFQIQMKTSSYEPKFVFEDFLSSAACELGRHIAELAAFGSGP